MINDYNHFKGGVDIADQLRSVYTFHISTTRTWVCLQFWLQGTVVTNSYVLLSHVDEKWKNKNRLLAVDLALKLEEEKLLSNCGSNAGVTSRGGCKSRNSAEVFNLGWRAAEAGGYVTSSERSMKPRISRNEHHLPERVNSSDRCACHHCRLYGEAVSRLLSKVRVVDSS